MRVIKSAIHGLRPLCGGFVLLLCVTAAGCDELALDAAAAPDPAARIIWQTYDEGLSAARQQNRPILLYFYADWCGFCKEMDRLTFQDQAIITYLNQHFIAIRVNSDQNATIARKYGVRGLPTSWFLTTTAENINHLPGFIPAADMLNILKYIHSDSYQRMSFQAFMQGS